MQSILSQPFQHLWVGFFFFCFSIAAHRMFSPTTAEGSFDTAVCSVSAALPRHRQHVLQLPGGLPALGGLRLPQAGGHHHPKRGRLLRGHGVPCLSISLSLYLSPLSTEDHAFF